MDRCRIKAYEEMSMRKKKTNILFFLNFIFYSALLGCYFYFFIMKYLIHKNSLSFIYRIDFLAALTMLLYIASAIAVDYSEDQNDRYSFPVFLSSFIEIILIALSIRSLGLDNPESIQVDFFRFYIISGIILLNTIIYNIFTEVDDKNYFIIGLVIPITYFGCAFLHLYKANFVNYIFFGISFPLVLWHWYELSRDPNFAGIFRYGVNNPINFKKSIKNFFKLIFPSFKGASKPKKERKKRPGKKSESPNLRGKRGSVRKRYERSD